MNRKMFKIIDLYILKKLFNILFFVLAAGIVIFLCVDLIENLDKFIDGEVSWSYIIRYYLYFIPYIIYLILPITILLATLFSLGSMSTANEITALKASGVSVYRILLVVAVPALFTSFSSLGFGETLVPYFNKQRMDIYRQEVKKIPQSSAMRRGRIYFADGKHRIVHIGHFNGETLTAHNINILEVRDNCLQARVDAKTMFFKKNHWILYDATRRDFIGDSVYVRKEPVMEWRELGFNPETLVKIETKPEEMNYWELREHVNNLVSTGADALRWRVELENKLATPFASFIIVIFGVPIAVVKRRSGLMVGFGISLLVAFLYFGATQSTKVLGYKGLIDPFLSVWAGHIIFGIIGVAAVLRVRK